MPAARAPDSLATACIRCGECAAACPSGIEPQWILAALKRDASDEARALGLDACSACAACDDACPSRIPLAGLFMSALEDITKQQRRQQFADRSRARHEARTQRMEREASEQAAERSNRRANRAAAQAVTAALARAGLHRKNKPG